MVARHADTATSTIEYSRTMCIPVVDVEYYGGQADRHRHQHQGEQQDSVYTCSGGRVYCTMVARQTDTATSTRENSRTVCIPVVEVVYHK
jgi:hypothetical protein